MAIDLIGPAIVQSATSNAHAGARDAVEKGPGAKFVAAVGSDRATDLTACPQALPVGEIKPGGKFFLERGGSEPPLDPFDALVSKRVEPCPVIIGTPPRRFYSWLVEKRGWATPDRSGLPKGDGADVRRTGAV